MQAEAAPKAVAGAASEVAAASKQGRSHLAENGSSDGHFVSSTASSFVTQSTYKIIDAVELWFLRKTLERM
jgi:hypothetical protein